MTDTQTDATQPLSVTMIADFACPWCRIGHANLDAAIEEWTGAPVQVTYLPFFLDPTLPPDGKNFREHLSAKFQGAPLDAMFERVSEAGARSGLTFRWDLVEKSPNTLLAHRAVYLAPDDSTAGFAKALYDAYFEHGRDLTDLDTILDIAAAAGIDRETLRYQLARGEGAREVESIARQVAQQGITGVPFFIFDGKLALSGAQPPGVILEALRQASEPALTPAD